jgi:hypothetical protein
MPCKVVTINLTLQCKVERERMGVEKGGGREGAAVSPAAEKGNFWWERRKERGGRWLIFNVPPGLRTTKSTIIIKKELSSTPCLLNNPSA